jgi:hypothetical protein
MLRVLSTNRNRSVSVLGVLALIGVSLSLFVMFQAGCAGDSKGGSLGNPIRALELEGLATLPFIVGLFCGACAIAFAPILSPSLRVTYSLLFLLVCGICLWLLGIQFEIWGVQSCFNSG